ncbi:CBS domain-containing protein [Streptomyces platensis]|uniref:CBS domain-containing protein n=1 Tax=Streptomyces platensis TaxID=58346 RepID=UPI003D9F5D1B
MLNTPHIVRDVMTKTVAAVDRDERFKEIVETMERWKVSALPVLAGEGRVVGVVSEADLLPKEGFREADPDRLEQLRRVDDVRRAEAVTSLMPVAARLVRAVEGVVDVEFDVTGPDPARTVLPSGDRRI